MNAMPIEYVEPFERAWQRMKALLFRPFDLGRWIVIGFTAWLATLAEGGGAGGGGNFNLPMDKKTGAKEVGVFFHQHLVLIISIVVAVILVLFIIELVLSWLSARGKFMFLDNAVTGGAEIAAPWQRWRRQGNSLFLWQVAYGFIMLFSLLLCIGLCVGLAWPDIHGRQFGGYAVAAIVVGFLLFLAFILTAAYIETFLHDFVVPLMRKHDLKTNAAWHYFLPLLRAQFGSFIVYGLLRLLIGIIVGLVLIFACCITCCCLWCLLVIPFLGTVVLLPVLAWKRYWGPEFLRQFGPEFDLWASKPPPMPAAQALVTAPY